MKVLILSTYSHTGGAAIAASRLLHALQGQGVEATMLCRRNIRAGWLRRLCPPSAQALEKQSWTGIMARALEKQSWTSILERAVIWVCNGFTRKDLWATDIALFGQDITKTREYREADAVLIHWVNQGFLSLNTIGKIARSGKRVLWTMHDEWPLEGVEHYTSPTPAPPLGEGEITGASREAAPTTPTSPIHPTNPINNLLTRWVMRRKARIYASGAITFVTCSEWLKTISEKKPLAEGQRIVSIPNPIDSRLFAPLTEEQRKEAAKALGLPQGKKIVLFVAQRVDDERKGIKYLDEAVKRLTDIPDNPESPEVPDNLESPEVPDNLESPAPADIAVIAPGRDIPYINKVEDMARLYACVDVFVTPSLSDNLPNTIMEAMACGTPCVGFDVGGIPEMIDHRENGYVARYKDAQDLAEGIRYVIAEENHCRLSMAAREKVMRCYSEEAVAKRYMAEYSGLSGLSGVSGVSGVSGL